MKHYLILLILSLSPLLPVWSAEPPVRPGSDAPASAWHAYNNAVAAWNQQTMAEQASARASALSAAQSQASIDAAAQRAILARMQAEQEAQAAARRREVYFQLLLDEIRAGRR